MDNRIISIQSEGRAAFDMALALLFDNAPGKHMTHFCEVAPDGIRHPPAPSRFSETRVQGYKAKTLVLFWHKPETWRFGEPMQHKLRLQRAQKFVWGWLLEQTVREEVEEDWRLEPTGATWQHQRFFRGAHWQEKKSTVRVAILDVAGDELDEQTYVLGKGNDWKKHDDFFERRLIARVVSTGCVAEGDCSNPEATHFAEAMVQLHTALDLGDTFEIPSNAASLELRWSAHPGQWTVPILHHDPGDVGYGFAIELEEVAPPISGYYEPGGAVSVRMNLVDGDGTPLFPDMLPSYAATLERREEARGLRYVIFPLPPPMLYWAHKDPQAGSETFIAGPLHAMTQVAATPITLFGLATQTQVPTATVTDDGWTGLLNSTPVTPVLFGCLGGFFALCEAPSSPIFTFVLPEDAESGTYVVGTKLRREWMGEPLHAAASIHVQVGSTTPTEFPHFTVPEIDDCASCHEERAALPIASHGFEVNGVGPECLACHTDGYFFEPDAGVSIRLEYLHAQTDRLDPPN